ncbi:hypothetical protein ISCGN_012834 [Ixodes scapularis]
MSDGGNQSVVSTMGVDICLLPDTILGKLALNSSAVKTRTRKKHVQHGLEPVRVICVSSSVAYFASESLTARPAASHNQRNVSTRRQGRVCRFAAALLQPFSGFSQPFSVFTAGRVGNM